MRLTLDGQIAPVAFLEYPSTNGDGPPYSSLTQGSDGAFYGTAGSSIASGSVFRVTTDGFVTNLVSFAGTNGSGPLGGVCIGSDGNFYGTTLEGGAQYGEGEGTVFKLTTNGVLSTLKRFPQADIGSYIYDGSEPWAGLCLGYDGFLYGTTACGGFFTNSVYTFGCGEIFRVTSNAVVGSGSFDETNGAWPASKLVAGNDGNLYGTTLFGGTNFGPGIRRGLGTIYRINPNHGITVLISFNSLNGAYVGGGVISTQPQPDLIIGNDGNLYGTSTYGGMGGNGTIFRVLLPADISVPPQSQTNIAGATVIFNVGATSLQPLIYQWQMSGTNLVDGGNVSGSGTSNLIVTEISDCDAGLYSVIVSNSNFGVTNFATLTVVDPPVITNQPIAQRVIVGNSVAFGISVSNAPVQYQWLFNSTNIIGATNAGFAIQSVAVTNSGIYCVVVTNLAGSVTSSNASLVVLVPPSLALQFTAGYPVLNLNGMLSNNFVVQYNTDLSGTNWTTLLSLSNLLTTPYLLLDPAGVVPPARFYRALMQ